MWMYMEKIRYWIEPRERRYVKGYGFLSITKKCIKIYVLNIVKNFLVMLKNVTDAAVTGNFTGNEIADKIRGKTKNSKSVESVEKSRNTNKKYMPPEKRQQIIDEPIWYNSMEYQKKKYICYTTHLLNDLN